MICVHNKVMGWVIGFMIIRNLHAVCSMSILKLLGRMWPVVVIMFQVNLYILMLACILRFRVED